MHDTLPKHADNQHARRPTIVCIDDDPDIPGAIALMLSNYWVDVIAAATGQQGIWQALCKSPDLVITDCRMPQGSGDLVLKDLKSLRKTCGVPVIVLTGLRDVRLTSHMLRLGAASFLLKPVSTAQLLAEIKKHVALREREEFQDPVDAQLSGRYATRALRFDSPWFTSDE